MTAASLRAGGTMRDIFVSYAGEDRDRIALLVQALEQSGWSVFWDRSIPAGSTWRQTIDAEIKACRVLLVAWTRSSVRSEWVLEEADIGKRRHILVPVLLDNVELPLGFGSIQAANLVGWSGVTTDASYRRLISDIEAVLGPMSAKGVAAADIHEHSEPTVLSSEPQPFREQESPSVANGKLQVDAQFGPKRGLLLRGLITASTKLSVWLKRTAGTFLAALIISVPLLVVCEIALGWHFSPGEISVIVSFVWIIVAGVATLRSRFKGKRPNASA